MSGVAAIVRPLWSAAIVRREPVCLGFGDAEELPQNLFGSSRGERAGGVIDRRHYSNALIVADLSFDPSYAEVLHETFGARVIGFRSAATATA